MKKIKYFLFIIPLFLIFTGRVSATTTVSSISSYQSYSSLGITRNNYYNEEKIYNFFNAINNDFSLNLDFSDYSNVFIYGFTSGSNVEYYFSNEEFNYYSSGSYTYLTLPNNASYLHIQIFTSNGNAKYELYSNYSDSFIVRFTGGKDHYSTKDFGFSNMKGLLDFSDYVTVNLEYDEYLFANDSNFKEVCVNTYDVVAIVSDDITDYDNGNPYYENYDFIWFKSYVQNIQVLRYIHDGDNEFYNVPFDTATENLFFNPKWGYTYYLSDKETIDSYWNNTFSPGVNLLEKGYTDKYKYYNYSFIPFNIKLTSSRQEFLTFNFSNQYVIDLEGNNIYNDSICFYIKNEYDVSIASRLLDNTYVFNMTILDDEQGNSIDYSTGSFTPSASSYGLVFNRLSGFINQIKGTIFFINSHIFMFFNSMPYIVRLFINSVLILLLVKFLINIITR